MKIALVTGASSGIGREFVRTLDKTMHSLDQIWVVARRKERLEELSHEIRTPLISITADLATKEGIQKVTNLLKKRSPKIKILINSAGFGQIGTYSDLPLSAQMDMIQVNCGALTVLTYACIPYMEEKARIIQLASSAAFLPQPGFAIYAATKSYVLSFSRALREELKPMGISVTAVCPGPVKTEFFDRAEKTGTIPLYKRLVMADPKKVVNLAFKDALKRKSISVYGITMKLFRVLSKLVPHEWILKFL